MASATATIEIEDELYSAQPELRRELIEQTQIRLLYWDSPRAMVLSAFHRGGDPNHGDPKHHDPKEHSTVVFFNRENTHFTDHVYRRDKGDTRRPKCKPIKKGQKKRLNRLSRIEEESVKGGEAGEGAGMPEEACEGGHGDDHGADTQSKPWSTAKKVVVSRPSSQFDALRKQRQQQRQSRHPQSTWRTDRTPACRGSFNNTHARPSTQILAERRIGAMSGRSRPLIVGCRLN
jgi:hypothetical protein